MDGDVSKPARASTAELEAFLVKTIDETAKFGKVRTINSVADYDIDSDKQTIKVFLTIDA